jgi:hypothetical protein
MALLAPACICFANQMRPQILAVLKGDGPEGRLTNGFQTAVQAMQDAIAYRLASARAEVDRYFLKMNTVPWRTALPGI